ncbi:Plasma-membrane_choline transporter domain-containing protein [Hexamita inflata]|uniref:Choline transporter-like protein n=1 Tax=Hexamita inflata TaxID=28002 RepID=A0AA86Q4B6_9EUKA|nr:Plasma-membrane choline transporter domain-containing protein [Hexamita inflata]
MDQARTIIPQSQINAEKLYKRKVTDIIGLIFYTVIAIFSIAFVFSGKISFQLKSIQKMFIVGDQFSRACNPEQVDSRYPTLQNIFNAEQINLMCQLHCQMGDMPSVTNCVQYCNTISVLVNGTFQVQDAYQDFIKLVQATYQTTQYTALESDTVNICIPQSQCIEATKAYQACDDIMSRFTKFLVNKDMASQILSESEYTDLLTLYNANAPNYGFLLNTLCHNLHQHTFKLKTVLNQSQCVMTDYSAFAQKLTQDIKIPSFLQYFFNWLFNLRSYYVSEIASSWKGSIIAVAVSVALSYIILLLLLLIGPIFIWVGLFIFPLGILAAGIYLIVYSQTDLSKVSIQEQIFIMKDANKPSSLYILTWIFGVILVIVAFVALIVILVQRKDIKLSVYGLRLSWCVLAKRLRLFFFPLTFIIAQVVNISATIIIAMGISVTGQFNIQLGIFQLIKYTKKFEIITMSHEIGSIIVIILCGLIGYFFINASFIFFISQLTYFWYFDRISKQFSEQKLAYRDPKTKQVVKKMEKQGTIFEHLNMGSGNSFKFVFKNFFVQIGSTMIFSIFQLLVFIPKILCKLLLMAQSSLNDNPIVVHFQKKGWYQKYIRWMQILVDCSDKENMFYIVLTGNTYWNSSKNCKQLLTFNLNLLKKIMRVSYGSTYLSRIFVSIASIGILAIFEKVNISNALTVFVCSFMLAGFIFNMIHYINMALIFSINFDNAFGNGQKENRMPKQMKHLLDAFKDASEKDDDHKMQRALEKLINEKDEPGQTQDSNSHSENKSPGVGAQSSFVV